ncbi:MULTISPECIES: TetR family transcriptional regulator [unclassified Streptomyces]|uniref:TetR/AcrR family transcriptional regulator n=1 Tax=unclassified Streptomyces TaxID=2593676 RepID=UPI0006FD7111|nr:MULTISPECIES: TetR family transcriptional regulator [unclassified Streptomyces]KQX54696.1 TetR family transcriptional regulator [Streptomyces sp. Root1304]KRA93512.1 TetR family transcriptional regulator [Streptomyces sp. Root66D1]
MSTERERRSPRRGPKGTRTREALGEAALRLVLEHGTAGVSVEDVTDAVGVSRRTFSRYFASKEEAVLDGIRADCVRINEALAARPARETPLTAYRAALRVWLADPAVPAWHRRAGVREVFRLAEDEAPLRAVLRRLLLEGEAASVRLVATRIGADSVRDLRPAVAVGSGAAALMAATRAWVADGDPEALPGLVEEAFALLAAEPP